MTPRKPLHRFDSRPRRVADLTGAGIPRWRLYGSAMERPIHGVIMTDPASTPFDKRVRALSAVLRPGQFFSRRTAAHLHGLPLARLHPSDDRVDIGSVGRVRPPRRPQVRGHSLRPGALEQLPSAPFWLPAIEDSWCLLAQVATKAELLAAADYILSGPSRFEEPLATRAVMEAAIARFQGCTGSALRSEVWRLARTGVESPAESELRLLLLDAGFAEPITCCAVPCGSRTFHADLGYPSLKIAIEYEGAYHFGENALEQARRDVARVRAMEAAGWKVLRVTVHDLRRPNDFLAELAQAIRERGGRV